MTDTQKYPATRSSGLAQPKPAGSDMPRRPDAVEPASDLRPLPSDLSPPIPNVALLTAGRDKPYALGLAAALSAAGMEFDFIGSNEVDSPALHGSPRIHFFNLRGDQCVGAGLLKKVFRVLVYYARLLAYAATAKPRIFHILWNNKFELFDRTVLMLYYRLLGKKIVLTVHNVNAGLRDRNDSWLNRATLKFQYHRCQHIFVHTEKMKQELMTDFGIPESKTSVVPFGLNSTVPDTALTTAEARQRLGLGPQQKVLLFFGNIALYKGLEYLIDAFTILHQANSRRLESVSGSPTSDLRPLSTESGPPTSDLCPLSSGFRLIIAGRPKGSEVYWAGLLEKINSSPVRDRIILKIEYVPDAETEIYFKAADVLVLPYTHIFQSGVLFLGYNFGLPVIAADVGSLMEEIIEGKTGFVFPARDSLALANVIESYFSSDLFNNLVHRRQEIKDYANERYSWAKVAQITSLAYCEADKIAAKPSEF